MSIYGHYRTLELCKKIHPSQGNFIAHNQKYECDDTTLKVAWWWTGIYFRNYKRVLSQRATIGLNLLCLVRQSAVFYNCPAHYREEVKCCGIQLSKMAYCSLVAVEILRNIGTYLC